MAISMVSLDVGQVFRVLLSEEDAGLFYGLVELYHRICQATDKGADTDSCWIFRTLSHIPNHPKTATMWGTAWGCAILDAVEEEPYERAGLVFEPGNPGITNEEEEDPLEVSHMFPFTHLDPTP